jgi:hypothetical protein
MGDHSDGQASQSVASTDFLRLEIRKAGREAIEALKRLATREGWTDDRLSQLRTRLIKQQKELPAEERAFSERWFPAPSNPRKFAGWIKLLELPDDRYVGKAPAPQYIFQAAHTLRLHRTLQELGIIQGTSARSNDFEELTKRYEFLHRAAGIIDKHGTTLSEEKKSGSEKDGPAYTETSGIQEADALRLIDPRIAGKHERAGIDFVRGL